tara:strand:- start:94 stop:222 length:129 start_codon:yes stop_codon:yes gene_type:complete
VEAGIAEDTLCIVMGVGAERAARVIAVPVMIPRMAPSEIIIC